MRILIVKRDKLGDMLLTLPVIARLALRLPAAEIHLLANDYNAWVARDAQAPVRLWVYRRVRERGRLRIGALAAQAPLAWNLVRQRFDWAIAMGGSESHRAIARAIASGAHRVVAYAQDATEYSARLTDPLAPPALGHELARMFALLMPLGIDASPQTSAPVFDPPIAIRELAAQWLGAQRLEPGGYVVIGLGARRGKKKPDAAQVLRWARWLHSHHGLRTVLMWTPGSAANATYPGDDELASAILERAGAFVHPYRGPIRGSIGIIDAARTSVIPDSGLMHFAAASPGGVLGLFADPADSAPAERWAPLGPRARHVEAPVTVAELPDGTIFAALESLLAATPARETATG